VTSVTTVDDDLTSDKTITSVNNVRAATSVTTKDGDVTSNNTVTSEGTTEAAYRADSVTTLDGELSSNKTVTSVDDVTSWWDKKNARVASHWWDTKNQRVASAWWDTKNIRVSSHWWDNDKAQKKVQKKARVASPWWDTKKSQKKARVASWWDTKNVKDWDWDTKAKSAKVAKNYGYKGHCGTKVTVPKGHTFTCLDQDDNRRVNCLVQSAIQYRCCTDEDGCREADDFTYWRF